MNERMKGQDLRTPARLNPTQKASSLTSRYCLKWGETLSHS